MSPENSFYCEVEKLTDKDQAGNRVTVVMCHGRLVGASVEQLKEVVKPLIADGGRVVIDLGDLEYLDSAGLGALVGLKVSAIRQGYCILELDHVTPRVLELLRLTHLTQVFIPR